MLEAGVIGLIPSVLGLVGGVGVDAGLKALLAGFGIDIPAGGIVLSSNTIVTALIAGSSDDTYNVLEISSFQLESIESFHPKIAAILNITPDHLDRHYTLEKYAAAKGRLFETQQARDCAVLNADDPLCAAYANLTRGKVYWFSLEHPVSPGAWLESRSRTIRKLCIEEGVVWMIQSICSAGRDRSCG